MRAEKLSFLPASIGRGFPIFWDRTLPVLKCVIRRESICLVAGLVLVAKGVLAEDHPRPVYVGLDAEFGLADSTSAQAIEKGILIAMDEINRTGGVLGGRPLVLETTDNRSVPARAIKNLRELAKIPDLVAVFGGRFSPVVMECVPIAQELELILLAPWSAADDIIDNGMNPNYVFRLSLRDSIAMPTMLRYALSKGAERVGLLVPNTLWGRSNVEAAKRYYAKHSLPRVVAKVWFNWGDPSMIQEYQDLLSAGAEAIVFVANDAEAVFLVRELANLPDDQLVPIISHWGVTGGHFAGPVGPVLDRVDFSVVQTFSFFRADRAMVDRVLAVGERLFGVSKIEDIQSPVGVAHAYDLTHILAQAIDLAGTTERKAVREALETVGNYNGLVKYFLQPFSPTKHEALGPEDVFMARYHRDGTIRPIETDD